MPCVFLVGESHTVYAYVATFTSFIGSLSKNKYLSALYARVGYLSCRPTVRWCFPRVSLDAGTRSQMLNYHLHMSSHVESDGSKRR